MANKSLTDLTARTATADSDLLHINSGGTDYKETKANFSANLAKWVDFGNSSALTTQIDALAGDCAYEGLILSYGHQTETGVPINANFYVDVIKIASGAGRVKIYALNSSAKPVSYINFKSGGAWQGWVQDPTRDEITSLNNSLANSLVKNPSNIASYNEFDALATSGGFYAFRLSASFTIGGVALPNYGRGLIMNYSSTDSSFIYVSPDGFWFGFKNSGTWHVKRASTF